MTKQLSCVLELKVKKNILELTSIASDKSNQNDNLMKTIKIEQNNLVELNSKENSNEKNKGMNEPLVS